MISVHRYTSCQIIFSHNNNITTVVDPDDLVRSGSGKKKYMVKLSRILIRDACRESDSVKQNITFDHWTMVFLGEVGGGIFGHW